MKRRSESFLGIHFDFHALPGQAVPTCWHPEYFGEMLDAVKPDFVQCDTKGHAGLSSYPTHAGTRAEPMTQDILRMMREETWKRDIALYGHHSGIYDQRAVALHPEWAVVDAAGKPSADVCSVFSPFADELLLPQLRELAGEYQLDGAWIDGECWALKVDYSHWAVERYRSVCHREPARPGEEGAQEYREFCRRGFVEYVRHYTAVIQQEFPAFQITSNWIYSALMPEAMAYRPDFLSGDYSTTNSVESARFEGRVLEARDVPWDLMAWGHNAIPCSWTTRNRTTKEPRQYCQEAALVVAMGGCFECFNILYGHGGTVQHWAIPTWARMAEFCRARQECFRARIRPELGIVFPSARNAEDVPGLYDANPGRDAMRSWINILQDCQFSTRVIFQHQLEEAAVLARYQAIVLPNTDRLSASAVECLCRYVHQGGKLLVDAKSIGVLPSELTGISEVRWNDEPKLIFVDGGGALAAGEVPVAAVTAATAEPSGYCYDDNYYESNGAPAAWQQGYGQGRVAALGFSMQHFYAGNRCTAIRDFIRGQLTQLGFRPLVRVDGSSLVELTVTEQPGKLLVNLINMAGQHNVPSVRGYDEIPALGPLTVTFAPECRYTTMRLLPGNTPLEGIRLPDGSTEVTLPRLEIHAAIVAEP